MEDRSAGAVRIEVAEGADTANLVVQGEGSGHRLSLAAGIRFPSTTTVTFGGSASIVELGTGVSYGGAIVVHNGAAVRIGEGSTFGRVELIADAADIDIGADCMFSYGIELRTTDAHPLFDVRTGRRINPRRPITVEDYVWVGKQVTVMKGVRLGTCSAVALRSVVTVDVPSLCVVAGVPARVVRRGTIWTRYTRQEVLADDPVAAKYLERLDVEELHGEHARPTRRRRLIARLRRGGPSRRGSR